MGKKVKENKTPESSPQNSSEAPPQLVPEPLYIFPLLKRPFFPGMAAPLVIEPGKFFEALKEIAATEHKSLGLLLMKNENLDAYNVTFDDLYEVGVLAKILRIIPMDQGGVQVVL